MIKPKPIFWIALLVLALIYFNNRERPAEPPAPTATAAVLAYNRIEITPVPTLPLPTPAAPDPYAYAARNWEQIMPDKALRSVNHPGVPRPRKAA